LGYYYLVILSFADRDTEALFRRQRVRRIDQRIQQTALRKLLYLDNAMSLDDLRIPPGNLLEALRGRLAGRHSIRINDQWRIVFVRRQGTRTRLRSWTTTDGATEQRMTTRRLRPVHPGEVLRLDFLEPMDISVYRLAKATGISAQHLGRIVKRTRGISGDVALRLARFFGTSAHVWMGLQARYELDMAEIRAGREIEKRVQPYKAVMRVHPRQRI
jgi:proteic killer suppression protein